MKRIVLYLAASLMMFMVGCTKEESSLVGTKWVMAWDDAKKIVEFTTETDVRIYEADDNLNYSDFLHEGKYSYESGKVVFNDEKIFLSDVWGITMCYYYYFKTATVDGDVLHVSTTGKKVEIDLSSLTDTWTVVDGKDFTFMKVK